MQTHNLYIHTNISL